jgi:hypothetical protein
MSTDANGQGVSDQRDCALTDDQLKNMFLTADTGGLRDEGKIKQLKHVVRKMIFPGMKFVPGEGMEQGNHSGVFGSYEMPDLRMEKGFVQEIMKHVGMQNQDKTMEQKVAYWTKYHPIVKSCIQNERSTRTSAMKDCMVQGKVISVRLFWS